MLMRIYSLYCCNHPTIKFSWNLNSFKLWNTSGIIFEHLNLRKLFEFIKNCNCFWSIIQLNWYILDIFILTCQLFDKLSHYAFNCFLFLRIYSLKLLIIRLYNSIFLMLLFLEYFSIQTVYSFNNNYFNKLIYLITWNIFIFWVFLPLTWIFLWINFH